MESLEPLLVVQDHDIALDRLRHRHATLPERAEVASAEADVAALTADIVARQEPLAELARTEQRFEDEAQKLSDQADAANTKLYSGEITSPKELQALQAKILPVIDQIGKEMGVAAIFNKFESGLVYASDAIDITDTVVKRFDTATGGAAAPAAAPATKKP